MDKDKQKARERAREWLLRGYGPAGEVPTIHRNDDARKEDK